jgi:hypothetical protein
MLWTKVVEKLKTHILCSTTVFRKPLLLWDKLEKYGGARGVTNNVTKWGILFEWWISKATLTHEHKKVYAPGHPHVRSETRARTHRRLCNTHCLVTATTILERFILYTYIVCLVGICITRAIVSIQPTYFLCQLRCSRCRRCEHCRSYSRRRNFVVTPMHYDESSSLIRGCSYVEVCF